MTDPIADYLTRLRNAIMAHHRVVEVPASNLKKEITKILFEKVTSLITSLLRTVLKAQSKLRLSMIRQQRKMPYVA